MTEPPAAAPRRASGIVWEQRWHPLREEWVLLRPHRNAPARGGRPAVTELSRPQFDPSCPLCPGNQRPGGRNPDYEGVLVIGDDLPPPSPPAPGDPGDDDPLYRVRRARGTAEVVSHHPHHSLSFAELSDFDALAVVETWAERRGELGRRREVNDVLVFEGSAARIGPSAGHSHSRLYAGERVHPVTQRELEAARRYQRATGGLLGLAVLEREEASQRVVVGNEHFVACVPWFARRAYEILILPRAPAASLADLDSERRLALATLMRDVAIRYDNLERTRARYLMAVHQAPTTRDDVSCHPFHVEYLPEIGGPADPGRPGRQSGEEPTVDTSPDEAAAELKRVASRLYRESS